MSLQTKIEKLFREPKSDSNKSQALEACAELESKLNSGEIRVAQKVDGIWAVNSWVKEGILLGFKYLDSKNGEMGSYDKVSLLQCDGRYRKVAGSIIRSGTYIADGCIIMPSFINIGAYIDSESMIDINAAIGSCAQIGKKCHISALACVGGVLEPVVATPVIIEDNVFVGAGSSVLEGVIVEEGSIIASGVTISSSTKIINRDTQEEFKGVIPKGSVVVGGSYASTNGLNINCAVIIKTVDEATKNKISINEILRN